MTNLRHARNLLANLIFGGSQPAEGRCSFALDAGIGDTLLYLKRLEIYCHVTGDAARLYVPDFHVNLLKTENGRRVDIRPLSTLSTMTNIINLSPHALIGGMSGPLRKRAAAYFLRALLRKFRIYVLNEYDLADRLLKGLYTQTDAMAMIGNPEITQFVICPDTSLDEKAFSELEIKQLIKFIDDMNHNASIDVISNRNLALGKRSQKIFRPRFSDYSYQEASLFICADSALLHYFHGEGFRVVMVAKSNHFRTFAAMIPIWQMDTLMRVSAARPRQ